MKGKIICTISLLLVLAMVAGLSGCALGGATLNGVKLEEYTVVYSQQAPDYCQRAAEYIQQQILEITGLSLPVCEASTGNYPHEILVGMTDRELSKTLYANKNTDHVEFAFLADENHIAIAGDYFIIAAAAYYFVDACIIGKSFQSQVPQQISVCQPVVEPANNYIFLIGDGMGQPHTRLFETMSVDREEHHDNENVFYGYCLPYQGVIRTDSLSGVTDSAAGATALACGYKTTNGYVGMDRDENHVTSLTELAASLGKSTAVLSTDQPTGATPAGFSAHVNDRNDSAGIREGQTQMMQQHGTLINCSLHTVSVYQDEIVNTLEMLERSENGFFIMYEEAYIDKFSHNQNIYDTFSCMVRFNQAIGVFMEYCFYHPDTLLLITADHETGGLTLNDQGEYSYTTNSHTGADVPIFAYGYGAQVFDGYNNENTDVPKELALMWGVEDFGQD